MYGCGCMQGRAESLTRRSQPWLQEVLPSLVGVAFEAWVPRKLGWWSTVILVCWTCSSSCVVGSPQWPGSEHSIVSPKGSVGLWPHVCHLGRCCFRATLLQVKGRGRREATACCTSHNTMHKIISSTLALEILLVTLFLGADELLKGETAFPQVCLEPWYLSNCC